VARVAISMFGARWFPPLISTLAILALGIGCGGGSERVTAAELVQKADTICGKERSSYQRVQAHPPPNASIAADQTGELIQATEDANSQLRDLKPPDELQASYDRYLEARDRVVDEMKRGRDAAEDQDSNAYGAAQAAVARGAPQRKKLAASLGLRVCSSSSATA
jgi:hypothetical protein